MSRLYCSKSPESLSISFKGTCEGIGPHSVELLFFHGAMLANTTSLIITMQLRVFVSGRTMALSSPNDSVGFTETSKY